MKIEYQVCSLELSKRLKELGVKQESYFWWVKSGRGPEYEGETNWKNDGNWNLYDRRPVKFDFLNLGEEVAIDFSMAEHEEILLGIKNCSAFTVAELGEMLPIRVNGTILVMGHLHNGWTLQYRLHDSIVHEIRDQKEADARAKMLVYLFENNLLKLEAKP